MRQDKPGVRRDLKGYFEWRTGACFRYGYPGGRNGRSTGIVGYRLANRFTHNRSQRRYRLSEDMTYYARFRQLGLEFLGGPTGDSR